MRYHELALQWWLNKIFTLRWGVPVPVVFTSPMDAFSLFSKLWSEANNPFQYLLSVTDDCGNPLYQPYPAPVRYPVISVYRKGWKYRQYQNYSIHRMRWMNWPTVSSPGPGLYGVPNNGTNLTLCKLGEVTTSRFPMAFDYRFQVDHFCNRPDTQAFFTSQLFREFWRTGGTVLQTWIKVTYPGMGDKLIRLYLDGDIENLTPEEPPDGQNVEYRTSFTVVVEGYDLDLDYKIYPALWNLLFREGSAPPEALTSAFEFTGTIDLREQPQSSIVDYRQEVTVMPPPGTCAVNLRDARLEAEQVHEIIFNGLAVQPDPNTAATPPGYIAAAGAYAFGQASIFATPPLVVDGGTVSDSGSNTGAFHVGSMDLYIYVEQAPENVTFSGGTYFPVTLSAGTIIESGSMTSAFTVGTYADTIVSQNAGTEYGTLSVAFGTGTYADVVVDAGSYYESGSLSSAFTAGTYTALILSAGTHYEAGSMSAGFYNGTYSL